MDHVRWGRTYVFKDQKFQFQICLMYLLDILSIHELLSPLNMSSHVQLLERMRWSYT